MRLPPSPARSRALAAGLDRILEGRVVPLAVALGALACFGLGAGIAAASPDPPDILPLGDVKPGMKGYGLTVMSGTTPEKFDVEVISTLHSFRPNQDLILIKTPNNARLDAARTVAGMSGSPIYLNGKMIGAYAYGWTFGVEPIAGVTPIKSMLDELARPIPKALVPPRGSSPIAGGNAAPAKLPRTLRAFDGAPDHYDLMDHEKQVAKVATAALQPPEGMSLARASTPVLFGGISATGLKIASDVLAPLGLEPLQAGGGAAKQDPNAPTKFVDGGAIGVELIRGDVSAMGLGTVTRVSGDKLVAFGHPMLQGGVEALPTAIAKVHWILASSNRSFKIGEAVRSMGALVNDRQAAIVVDSAAQAPVFPVALKIDGVDGAPKKVWNMTVTADQFMAPAFAAMAIGSAAEATTAERRDQTWRATTTIKVAGKGSIELRDFASGSGTPISAEDFMRTRVVRALGAILNNPWETVKIDGVETTLTFSFEREYVTLRSAKILQSVIDAGQPAQIRLDLQPYQGPIEHKIIEVPIPKELAGHEVDIELVPGYEVERPLASPDSVSELLSILPNQYFDGESVVAVFRLRENGAAYKGQVASRLPPGAMDLLRPATQSDAPEAFAAQSYTAIPLKRFLVGRDSVHVEVRQVIR